MPKTLPIVTLPAPSLRERSVEVEKDVIGTPEFQTFLDDLIQTMYDDKGVGIAAVQVGRNIRVFIVDYKDGPRAFINPTVEPTTKDTIDSDEGCLSVPGTYGIIKRFKKARVTALDRHGRQVAFDVRGFTAIVFQHEFDHLNGILFVDHNPRITKIGTTVRV